MPNWCNNTLELAHKDPAMIVRARDAFNRGELLQEFIPVPESLHIVAGCVSDEAEQAKLEADTARNMETIGYGNWYDYCVAEWGTKWDVGLDGSYGHAVEIQEDGRLTLSFDSAWSPPVPAYEKLMELGFEVRAYYFEGGMMFAGVWEDGFDDYVELGGMTSDQIKDEIPEALDEMFGISESLAEYEAEEELDEDLYTFVTEGAEQKAKSE
jgi:hypothetical protein